MEKDKKERLETYRDKISAEKFEKLERIVEKITEENFVLSEEMFEVEEFWQLDDETFKNLITNTKYIAPSRWLQQCFNRIVQAGKLEKWLEIKKQEDFLPQNPFLLEDIMLNNFSLSQIKILSDEDTEDLFLIIDTFERANECGTFENICKLYKIYINEYEETRKTIKRSIKKVENYTDENVELFGLENIEKFGNGLLENEEYIKNYKAIKERYGQMLFGEYSALISVLSDENVRKIGYEKIYKYFNNIETGTRNYDENKKRLNSIPEDVTPEILENVILIYGEIPLYREMYDKRILDVVQKAKENNETINFKSRLMKDRALRYILENGLEKNLGFISNIDMNKFCRNGYFYYNTLKILTPEIINEFGEENIAYIVKKNNVETVLRAKEKGLLGRWRRKIEETSRKDIICSINNVLLLDEKNDDLTLAEIERILKRQQQLDVDIEKLEKNLEDNPEYIKTIEVPFLVFPLYNKESEIEEIEDFNKIYEEFKNIRESFGANNFVNILNEESLTRDVYEKMREANRYGTIKNWKKLLEVDENFVPKDVLYISDGLFANNTLEEIMELNKLDFREGEKIRVLIEKSFDYIFTIKEMIEKEGIRSNGLYEF